MATDRRDSFACDELSVHYGSTLALDGVSLRVAAGEVLALLGPSGSGKTTLLHGAAGFVAPSRGAIRIGGREVS
ncbi:MAG TPA: ATP-binding cassette domain-containing protein, partial [Chloroflexota bacterium]|nr:ATP-binding cassette domain-containing protein [Chloroflexota bacterium]